MSDLFTELKRRNVFRVGIAYVVLAWLVLQVADVIVGNIAAPDWVFKVILLFLALGLPFAIFFAWAFELTPEGVKRESEVDRSQSITQQTGRKLDFTIIAILVLAVGYFAFDKFVLGRPNDNASPDTAAQAPADPPAGAQAETDPSIAVLPFVNMSDDASNEYFSDGISEEILNTLASVRELKVAGRTSSFAFKDKNEDLRVIGDALGVDHILEGSVRKAGTRVRITAQLIQVEDGFHLWSDTFDRELNDVFAIQDEIANAILEQLKAQLLDGEIATAHSMPTDPEAYDKYLLAKQRIYERNRLSLEAAVALLEETLEIDPEFAPAHAQLAIATLMLREGSYGNLPRSQALEESKPHVDAALAQAPDLAEAWAALGLYRAEMPGGSVQAIEALEKALSLNPNLIDASNWLQSEYAAKDLGKAVEILESIHERDPLYRPGVSNLVSLYNLLGMQEKSLTLIRRTESYMPGEPWLTRSKAETLFMQGRYAEGFPLAKRAAEQLPDDWGAQLTYSLGLFFTYQLDKLEESSNPFAGTYGAYILGRREEAMMRAHEAAGQGMVFILLDLLSIDGRHEELIRFVEDRWEDLDAFEADFPSGNDGYSQMINIALAYQMTGNDERFGDAMRRVRRAHDELQRQGVKSLFFDGNETAYYSLAGEYDVALDFLARAVDKGWVGTPRIARTFPVVKPLEGDPRYEAIQARMIEKVNGERAALGLEPIEV